MTANEKEWRKRTEKKNANERTTLCRTKDKQKIIDENRRWQRKDDTKSLAAVASCYCPPSPPPPRLFSQNFYLYPVTLFFVLTSNLSSIHSSICALSISFHRILTFACVRDAYLLCAGASDLHLIEAGKN